MPRPHSSEVLAQFPDTVDLRKFAAMLDTLQLNQRLFELSSESVRVALGNFSDHVLASYSAGQALEHLAKAVIFHHDPSALAAKGRINERSVRFLLGEGHPDAWSLVDIQTIAGPASVVAAHDLIGSSVTREATDPVFFARNAAAHLGHAETTTTIEALRSTLLLAMPLLKWMDHQLEDWIGDEILMHSVHALAQHQGQGTTRIECEAYSAVWRARHEWESLRDRLPTAELQALVREPTDKDDHRLLQCPTGGHLAWFHLDWEVSDVQDLVDDPDSEVEMESYLAYINCPLCGLELDNSHFEHLGIDDDPEYRVTER